jgi:hypothetical protein
LNGHIDSAGGIYGGGAGGGYNIAGKPGIANIGGGGGGGGNSSTSTRYGGGNGGNGVVIIYYTYF